MAHNGGVLSWRSRWHCTALHCPPNAVSAEVAVDSVSETTRYGLELVRAGEISRRTSSLDFLWIRVEFIILTKIMTLETRLWAGLVVPSPRSSGPQFTFLQRVFNIFAARSPVQSGIDIGIDIEMKGLPRPWNGLHVDRFPPLMIELPYRSSPRSRSYCVIGAFYNWFTNIW